MFYFVDLQALLKLALHAARARVCLPSQGAPLSSAFLADAPRATPAGGSRRSADHGSDPIQALADLDLSTVWPTRRIRSCLHVQPAPGTARWR